MHLLNQGRIPREAAGVKIAHLIDESLQLLACFGTVLNCGAHLIQQVQSLINFTLRIGGSETLLGSNRPSCYVSVAGIHTAEGITIAVGSAASRISDGSCDTVTYGTSQPSPTCLATLRSLSDR